MRLQVHICGASPRSGTTLVHGIMANCFLFDRKAKHESRFYNPPSTFFSGTFVSKYPTDLRYINDWKIHDRVPDFRTICVVRDPRDVVLSEYKDEGWFFSPSEFVGAAAQVEKISHHKNNLTIRYEDLVSCPELVEGQIERFLPELKKIRPFRSWGSFELTDPEQQHALHVNRPIDQKGINRWLSATEFPVGFFDPSFLQEVVDLGYAESTEETLISIRDRGHVPKLSKICPRPNPIFELSSLRRDINILRMLAGIPQSKPGKFYGN